ncbi:MAG: AI-2E family transporter, partial [Candidatus Thermoplasmatota archaeon]|nr:AI-2E family transporter [Candidatus Thermoplasmatota archaeon]
FLTWRIVQDMRSLVGQLSVAQVSQQIETLALWSHQTFGYPADLEATQSEQIVRDVVPEIRSRLGQWIPQAITSIGSFLVGVFIMVLMAYYALIQGPWFIARLKRASPMDDTLEAEFLHEAKQTVDGVLLGQLVTAVLQGGLGFIAFMVAGLPNPFFWSFVMAILSFLPVVGAFFVWMPAAVYLFAIGDTTMGVAMILWGLLIISSVDNIVKPIVIGKRGQLHPLLAFVGVLGGLVAFGFMGFVMGPLVLSLTASVFNVLAETGWNTEEPLADQEPLSQELDPVGEPPAEREGQGDPAGEA